MNDNWSPPGNDPVDRSGPSDAALVNLLRSYRAEPGDDDARQTARLRLLTAASGSPSRSRRRRTWPAGSDRGRTSSRATTLAWRLSLPATAVCAGVAVLVAVHPGASSGEHGRYRLVRTTAPVYPVTPGFLPPGLAAPSYSLDAQGIVAVWTARTGSSAPAALPTASIFVRVSPERAPAGADDAAQPVAVSPGVTGQLWNRPAEGFAALVFQRGTSWIKVGGQSSLASPDVLLRVARSLTDQVRPVDVSVSLAPDGWQLAAFKDDVTTYDDPASDDRTRSLTVTVAGRYDPSRVGDGLVKPTDVMVLGRTGSQAVRGNIRYLAFPLSDGRAVTLSAPADMSLADLVRIAETTRLTGTR